jgi:hypothetical protein
MAPAKVSLGILADFAWFANPTNLCLTLVVDQVITLNLLCFVNLLSVSEDPLPRPHHQMLLGRRFCDFESILLVRIIYFDDP